MSYFMEIVFIELTDETRKITVFEVFWEDGFRELLALWVKGDTVSSTA